METKFTQSDDMETIWRWHALIWRLRQDGLLSDAEFDAQMVQWRTVHQSVAIKPDDNDPIWQSSGRSIF